MFCPKCKAEYREGFTECVDCQVSLVEELQPEPRKKYTYVELVTVLATGNPGYAAIAQSVLSGAGIGCFVKGEAQPYKGVPVEIQVAKQDEKIARELLKDLNESGSEQKGQNI